MLKTALEASVTFATTGNTPERCTMEPTIRIFTPVIMALVFVIIKALLNSAKIATFGIQSFGLFGRNYTINYN